MTEDSARAFLAFEIPGDVKARIEEARAGLREELPPARWTRPGGWHLTLKFLGEVEREALETLGSRLEPDLSSIKRVTVRLQKTGFFPSSMRPRVAWIGGSAVGGDEVAAAVETAAASVGFKRERRPWSAHVTLARLKSQWPKQAVDRFLAWGDDLGLEDFVCREVVLFESDLQPGGAVYTALERFSLE
jgi:2'-5' RNA ligase